MSESETGTQALTTVRDQADDLELVACDAEEMKLAQGQMSSWFAEKKAIEERDLADLEASLQIASDHGWRTDALARQVRNAEKRVQFYDKCRLATEAGYCIVPNLPMRLFAIRTAKESPPSREVDRENVMQRSDAPPVGIGHNVSPDPTITERELIRTTAGGGKVSDGWVYRPQEFEEVEFPIAIKHPRVMNETARAMAMKVFDEIGIVVDREAWWGKKTVESAHSKVPKGDPLIVGVIRSPKRSKYDDRKISFLIAWHVDTRAL
jgi:hypothetical protein